MKKIDNFINQYSLNKTLRFRLIPEGNTLNNLYNNLIIDSDEKRAEDYQKMKKIIDQYHKDFIEKSLSDLSFDNLEEYYSLYWKNDKNNNEVEEFNKKTSNYFAKVKEVFEKQEQYPLIFKEDFIKKILIEYVEEKDKDIVKSFANFNTYFQGFYENRKNIYSVEQKSTEVGYRIIIQNMPKFFTNVKNYKKIIECLKNVDFKKLIDGLNCDIVTIDDIFEIDYFNKCLTQSGIKQYNELIGGYSLESGEKIKGINEYINEYNQLNGTKIPLLAILYKQILSDKLSTSFIPNYFDNDESLLSSIYQYINNTDDEKSVLENIIEIENSIKSISTEKENNIYISSNYLSTISNDIFKDWSIISELYNQKYENEVENKCKSYEKYIEKRNEYFKNKKYYSFKDVEDTIEKYNGSKISIKDFLFNQVKVYKDKIIISIGEFDKLNTDYKTNNKKLLQNENDIYVIKSLLDNIKDYLYVVKQMLVDDSVEQDSYVYGIINSNYEKLNIVSLLYNKCRNYLTKKPYSLEKIKINFNNSQFMNGWDSNKIEDYLSTILLKDGKYYLCIIDKNNKKVFKNSLTEETESSYKIMKYRLLPGANKMLPKVAFAKSNQDLFKPSNEIMKIYKEGSFKSGNNFSIKDCHKMIDFYKECINKYPSWQEFDYKFTKTEKYNNIAEFFREVESGGYKILFNYLESDYVDSLVESGQVYLFQIYSKDFSSYSKGNKNLHTMYFEALFDEDNLKNIVYQLNGGAEMFFRKKSIIVDKPTHEKGVPIKNKTSEYKKDNQKEQSVFDYDLIKDKRFTLDEFFLHLPIKMNFNSNNKENIKNEVRTLIKNQKNNYIIGIDRGERNLLYISVIDENKNIIEQFSTNILDTGINGEYKVDYHKMLSDRENERDKARKSWSSIESISKLKDGYLSFVVKKICDLVVKYDAIVVLEDLNSGFKRTRTKFEKQIYQKFEKALIEKMDYLVDKNKDKNENGGLYKAYQLCNKLDNFNQIGSQTGFLFYVPAWNTSKIDPTTGFTKLIDLKYKNIETTKKFISSFTSIEYLNSDNMFKFDLNYDNFDKNTQDYKKEWSLYSFGTRINKYKTQYGWETEEIDITNMFKKVFDKYGVKYRGVNIINEIINYENKNFYIELHKALQLLMQLRNSDDNNDYIISPVKNSSGTFFDSRLNDSKYPLDADANGAYHIALKGLWIIKKIKEASDVSSVKTAISNKEWLEFVQK